MILRILSPIFSQQKKRKKNDKTYARKRSRHNPAFSLHKKVGHTGTTVLPDKIVLRSHARPKDDVPRQERASYARRYSVDTIVSSFITLQERLSFAGAAKYIIDPLPATSTGSLDSRGIWPSSGGKCQ